MSYDIWLEADLGGSERVEIGALAHWNYTSNVSPMWQMAMPQTDGLAGLDGMRCCDALAVLRVGIQSMEAAPDEYRALNPENGWGDFESQLVRLHELMEACERAPDAFVAVSR